MRIQNKTCLIMQCQELSDLAQAEEIGKHIRDGDSVLEFVCENRNNMEITRFSKTGRQSGLPESHTDERHIRDVLIM